MADTNDSRTKPDESADAAPSLHAYYSDPTLWTGDLLLNRHTLVDLGSVVYGANAVANLLLVDEERRSDASDEAPLLDLNTRIGLGYALRGLLSKLALHFERCESRTPYEAKP
jgi:hypothetical protein